LWLVEDGPEVVAFWEAVKYPVPEVVVHHAVQENVGNCLSYRSAFAARAGHVWYFATEEEVLESNLFCPELYEKSAISLPQTRV